MFTNARMHIREFVDWSVTLVFIKLEISVLVQKANIDSNFTRVLVKLSV